jgi:hypothetical protein
LRAAVLSGVATEGRDRRASEREREERERCGSSHSRRFRTWRRAHAKTSGASLASSLERSRTCDFICPREHADDDATTRLC